MWRRTSPFLPTLGEATVTAPIDPLTSGEARGISVEDDRSVSGSDSEIESSQSEVSKNNRRLIEQII